MHVLGTLVLAAPAIPEDRPEQDALDEDEDERPQIDEDVEEVADVAVELRVS